jgi:hypothetical protein
MGSACSDDVAKQSIHRKSWWETLQNLESWACMLAVLWVLLPEIRLVVSSVQLALRESFPKSLNLNNRICLQLMIIIGMFICLIISGTTIYEV